MCRVYKIKTGNGGFALFKARPTRSSGMNSLLNIGGSMRFKEYLKGNDTNDLYGDWKLVGNDIKSAMKSFCK